MCSAAPKARPDLCGWDSCDGAEDASIYWGSDDVADQVHDGLVYYHEQIEQTPECSCNFRLNQLSEAGCCYAKLCKNPRGYVGHHSNPSKSASAIQSACA